jgi:hypothetical protein
MRLIQPSLQHKPLSRPIEWLRAKAEDPNVQRRRAIYMESANRFKVKVTPAGWEAFDPTQKSLVHAPAPVEIGAWTTLEQLHGESSCRPVGCQSAAN